MKKFFAALLGGALLSAAVAAAATPALALGGCGPNRHRNHWGHCVWGGQREHWCLRHTGHPAVRMPNGRIVCHR